MKNYKQATKCIRKTVGSRERKEHRFQRMEKHASFSLRRPTDTDIQQDFGRWITLYELTAHMPDMVNRDGTMMIRKQKRAKLLKKSLGGLEIPKRLETTADMQNSFNDYWDAINTKRKKPTMKDIKAVKKWLRFVKGYEKLQDMKSLPCGRKPKRKFKYPQ